MKLCKDPVPYFQFVLIRPYQHRLLVSFSYLGYNPLWLLILMLHCLIFDQRNPFKLHRLFDVHTSFPPVLSQFLE